MHAPDADHRWPSVGLPDTVAPRETEPPSVATSGAVTVAVGATARTICRTVSASAVRLEASATRTRTVTGPVTVEGQRTVAVADVAPARVQADAVVLHA